MTDETAKPALDDDNPEPPKGEKGERGLGTEVGATQAGDQDVLKRAPERRGEVKYPDVEEPDELRPDVVPKEGQVEEDPARSHDASKGARD
jgi:hypothetical protein